MCDRRRPDTDKYAYYGAVDNLEYTLCIRPIWRAVRKTYTEDTSEIFDEMDKMKRVVTSEENWATHVQSLKIHNRHYARLDG